MTYGRVVRAGAALTGILEGLRCSVKEILGGQTVEKFGKAPRMLEEMESLFEVISPKKRCCWEC
jgi:hypothetical protein